MERGLAVSWTPRRGASAIGAACFALAVLLPAGSTSAAPSAPDRGTAFRPGQVSKPRFSVVPPSENESRQTHYVEADDGERIFVQTFLPGTADGKRPPRRVPTVLVATPYVPDVVDARVSRPYLEHLVSRGYAYSVAMLRGTGRSEGCFDFVSQRSIDDVSQVVAYLGRDAPWSNGRVGMVGQSYMADIQIAVAARGERSATRPLKAIVPIDPVGGQYEIAFNDGVPVGFGSNAGIFFYNHVLDFAGGGVATNHRDTSCVDEQAMASADTSGNLTPFWREREYAAYADRVRAAVLVSHGFADEQPDAWTFFSRLPERVPSAAVRGWWEHISPDAERRPHRFRPEWARDDWLATFTAWFDRFLKGRRVPAIDRWPEVQVQASDGQWRAERSWGRIGGPRGTLALGDEGMLGDRDPRGSSSYLEGSGPNMGEPGSSVSFETPALPGRLQITGQPVLRLWVELTEPDAHIAASLELVGRDGELLQDVPLYALRSARHLAPLREHRFVQERGEPAPVGEPFRLDARFDTTDVVIPRGGRLRLTIAGSTQTKNRYFFGHDDPLIQAYGTAYYHSEPSGANPLVTVHHDCSHPSALRFEMPRRRQRLLNVREYDEEGPPRSRGPAVRTIPSSGGGLARPGPPGSCTG